jgi:histidinol-phosphate/aromatic aminotransferase/cobyric acid decarboxylase-like protein
LRDCGSFRGLGERWLRIGLQTRRRNRRIVEALRRVQSTRLPSRSTKR